MGNLKNNKDVIIKPADKGGTVCLINRASYIEEANRQLNNTKYYAPITDVDNTKLITEINKILLEIKNKGYINDKQFRHLSAKETDKDRFLYLLPKIHKDKSKWPSSKMPEGRPIVSNCCSLTRRVSNFIDHHIKPLATKHPSYLKDSYDFAEKIRNFTVNNDWLLVTGDITALYTNMKPDRVIEVVEREMLKNPDINRPDSEILQLLKLTLNNNTFSFNNKSYLQVQGNAMGTPDSPSEADLYLLEFDEQLRNGYSIKPPLYFRYLDDTFFLWPGTVDQLRDFETFLNSLIEDIKITLQHNTQQIPFLDMLIYKDATHNHTNSQTSTLQTKIYFKPTDSHLLLHTKSFHPKHTHIGLLKSQLIRFKRLSSSKTDYENTCKILLEALKNRGYSKRIFRKHKNMIWKELDHHPKRPDKKAQKNILPLVIKYSPISLHLTKIWRKNIIKCPKFQNLKIVAAYKKGRSLGQILAPSELTKT